MILEDGTEHQSSLDTALAQPQAQELVKKFIGDALGRSVTGQAKPLVIILVIILVLPLLCPPLLLPQLHPGGEDGLEGGQAGQDREDGGGDQGYRSLQHHQHLPIHPGIRLIDTSQSS